MGNKTDEIAVYPISVFCAVNTNFWMGQLEGLLERYSILENSHKQSFYMLLFIEQANGSAVIDNSTIRLDKSKLICIKPNSVFSIDINTDAQGKIICFTEDFFSLRYNHNVLYQFSFLKKEAPPFKRLSINESLKWLQIASLMEHEYNAHNASGDKVLRSYLNILLYELDRLYDFQSPVHLKNAKLDKVTLLEQLIEQHYKQKKMPSEYAKILCVSPNYLNKICKEETGQTAGELIRKRVIIEAQRLLYYTSKSVNEVADDLGFENASYFITFFKKQTGQTPEQFRKNS